jgi:hypothetical protein
MNLAGTQVTDAEFHYRTAVALSVVMVKVAALIECLLVGYYCTSRPG